MVTPKEKEVEKKELPKIVIEKPPAAAVELKRIPVRVVREEAREALSRSERNAARVAQTFVDHFTDALSKTSEGKQFLANMKKTSEIGNLLFA